MGRLATMAGLMASGLARGALAQAGPLDLLVGTDPDRFIARMTDLIAGFGGPNGLTADGIADYIALERAGARATAMRRMLSMDLDGDGALDRVELAVNQRAAKASARGRMERQFVAADSDRDGRVSQVEMLADGQRAALRALGEDEADALRALMSLDRDGDAAVTRDEVATAVLPVDQAT